MIDPGLIIKLGNVHTLVTERMQDAGTSAEFPNAFNDITLRHDAVEAGLEIAVEAHNMDKNKNSKKLLGIGKVRLVDVLPHHDELFTFTIPLDVGTVTMSGKYYHHHHHHHYYYYYYYYLLLMLIIRYIS